MSIKSLGMSFPERIIKNTQQVPMNRSKIQQKQENNKNIHINIKKDKNTKNQINTWHGAETTHSQNDNNKNKKGYTNKQMKSSKNEHNLTREKEGQQKAGRTVK